MAIMLSRSDVVKILDMKGVVDRLDSAFKDLSEGAALMPQRTPIVVPDHTGLALFMPAYIKGMGALGTKVVTVYKDNPEKYQMPTVLGTIQLLNERTGEPIALMDGGYLTAVRTGAVAGLATRYLSNKDASVHTLFGTGGMAKAHAWAIDSVRDIKKLVICSIDSMEAKQAFADSLKDVVSSEIVIVNDPEEAAQMADIVTLITSSKDPIINGDWFKPGTHINGMGSHAPAMRELDSRTISRSKVVCDLVDACKAEAGDFLIPVEADEWSWDNVHGSLGDVASGRIAGRENREEITLFKSVGLAIQDISTAYYVYEQAKMKKMGLDFNFSD